MRERAGAREQGARGGGGGGGARAGAREQGRAAAAGARSQSGGRAPSTFLKQPRSATASEGSHSPVLPARCPGQARGGSGRVLEKVRREAAFRGWRGFARFPFCKLLKTPCFARAWRGLPLSSLLADPGLGGPSLGSEDRRRAVGCLFRAPGYPFVLHRPGSTAAGRARLTPCSRPQPGPFPRLETKPSGLCTRAARGFFLFFYFRASIGRVHSW